MAESYGRKQPDKVRGRREPYVHFGGESEATTVSDIGSETQAVPLRTTKGGVQQRVTDRNAKAIRRAYKEDDGVDRITKSLVHDQQKGIEGTLSGGPVYFRGEQIRRLRGFNQAREPEVECDKIKHNPVVCEHEPFYQWHQPREKV